eukprot:COSAG01_NODE_48296_length_382_cov_2.021201_1_plen_22_part_01
MGARRADNDWRVHGDILTLNTD